MNILSTNSYRSNNKQGVGFGAFRIEECINPKKEVKILAMIREMSPTKPALVSNIVRNDQFYPSNSTAYYVGNALSPSQKERLAKAGRGVYLTYQDFDTIKYHKESSSAERTIVQPLLDMIDKAKVITMKEVKKAYKEFKHQQKLEQMAEAHLNIVRQMGKEIRGRINKLLN